MTGSHEVRGSIPLGSTNNSKHLRVALRGCPLILCAKCVRTYQISANDPDVEMFTYHEAGHESSSRTAVQMLAEALRLEAEVRGLRTIPARNVKAIIEGLLTDH
jgi:hypothetical protein